MRGRRLEERRLRLRPWISLVASYLTGWLQYDEHLRAPSLTHVAGLTSSQKTKAAKAYYVSANVVKASEDKTFPGAIVAGLSSPWGQAVSARPAEDRRHAWPAGRPRG